jgi:hypothetical protein
LQKEHEDAGDAGVGKCGDAMTTRPPPAGGADVFGGLQHNDDGDGDGDDATPSSLLPSSAMIISAPSEHQHGSQHPAGLQASDQTLQHHLQPLHCHSSGSTLAQSLVPNLNDFTSPSPSPSAAAAAAALVLKKELCVGVLHYMPTNEPFPLLLDPATYEPNTIDITSAAEEEAFGWWLKVLDDQVGMMMMVVMVMVTVMVVMMTVYVNVIVWPSQPISPHLSLGCYSCG